MNIYLSMLFAFYLIIGQEKSFDWIDPFFDQLHHDNGFSATIAILKDGKPVFQKAVGWEDVESNRRLSLDSRLNLGSGNKMFTAIAISQLVEQGKIKFDDTLIQFLPNYPDKGFAKTTTIDHLLSHRSGLGDYWDDEYERHWHNIKTLNDMLPFVTKLKPHFKPGERFLYSNAGYVLLGLIIENVTGKSYFEHIQQKIYDTSEMSQSGSFSRTEYVPHRATSYIGRTHEWSIPDGGFKGSSAGGGYSTIKDMIRFHNAFVNNHLLSGSTRDIMLKDRSDENNYGYAMILENRNGFSSFGHGGMAPGTYFNYRHFPDLGYTLIFFSNAEAGGPRNVSGRILDYIVSDEKKEPTFIASIVNSNSKPVQIRVVDQIQADTQISRDAKTHDQETQTWALMDKIIVAIKQKDLKSFHALFLRKDAASIASNESLFQFLSGMVFPSRGSVKGFHKMSDNITVPDSKYPMRVASFHLEDGQPGQIGISIKDGKVDFISLFIHPQLCTHGKTTSCKLVVREM